MEGSDIFSEMYKYDRSAYFVFVLFSNVPNLDHFSLSVEEWVVELIFILLRNL